MRSRLQYASIRVPAVGMMAVSSADARRKVVLTGSKSGEATSMTGVYSWAASPTFTKLGFDKLSSSSSKTKFSVAKSSAASASTSKPLSRGASKLTLVLSLAEIDVVLGLIFVLKFGFFDHSHELLL